MELIEQRRIKAGRKIVYEALNDVDVLKRAIPGCESLTKTSDTTMDAVASVKIGPVRAKFNGTVTLSDLNPPESYTITGEGAGGAAGFAKGSADIKLSEDGDETVLSYAVKADVGGKLAQLGARLIDSSARKLAGSFFEEFSNIVEQERAGAPDGADAGRSDFAASDSRPSDNTSPEGAADIVPGAGADAKGTPIDYVPETRGPQGPSTRPAIMSSLVAGIAAVLVILALLYWVF